MKKKSTIFFALLFACTMAFGFGITTTVSAGPSPCCTISSPFCQDSIGHWNEDFTVCLLNYTSPCDFPGPCF